MFEKTQFSTLNDRLARVHTKALEARSNRTHCLTLARCVMWEGFNIQPGILHKSHVPIRFAGKLQPILREVEIVTTISSNSSNVSAAAIVAIMNDVISRVVDLITRAGVTGKCRAIIQVESMIAEFQVCCVLCHIFFSVPPLELCILCINYDNANNYVYACCTTLTTLLTTTLTTHRI